MPHTPARDGTRLYYEEAGQGSAVIFVHEYAGDFRTWEPQMRHFARAHRRVTYSQRGYPPSDVPEDSAKYSQDIARDDVIAVMDALKIDKAHVARAIAARPDSGRDVPAVLFRRPAVARCASGAAWAVMID